MTPECEDSVLTHDALDPVLLMLPPDVPLFSKSPVLRCLRIFKPDRIDFLMPLDFSTRERLRTGGSSLLALSTKPPLESSTLRSRSAAASAPAVAPPSLLRSDVNDARSVLLGR